MADIMLQVADLSRTFTLGERVIRALDRCSLSIPARSTYALVGESGSGKSTLANLVVGLDRPTAGHILLDGNELQDTDRISRGRRVAFVQQNPYGALNPKHSIGSSIALPLIVHGIGNARSRRERVRELLELVGLPADVANRKPRSLSGGQRQRVAIARALAIEPELIVLDEPTSALDVSVQARILALLADLQKRLGLTYLLITHDLGVVRVMADRVGVLYKGRLLEEAKTDLLFGGPKHPYTSLLLSSVPTVDPADDAIKPFWPEMPPQEAADISQGCNFRDRCPFRIAACDTLDKSYSRPGGEHDHTTRCLRPRREWSSSTTDARNGPMKGDAQ